MWSTWIEMPVNKTLYVKDEDIQTWEKARQLAGEKLSVLITGYLKYFVALKEAEATGFERIVLKYREKEGLPRSQGFHGKWLIDPEHPWHRLTGTMVFPDIPCPDWYAVAMTSKRQVVIFNFYGRRVLEGEVKYDWGNLAVFPSFEEAILSKQYSPHLIAEGMERWGLEIEELDI
jgi:hypothetical protein